MSLKPHAAASRAGVRLAPPEAVRPLILRPRLLAVLQARFHARLTTVVAGPGFGKTSLLAQTVAENRLAPRGRDIWLTCREDDAVTSSLAGGVSTAFQLAGPSSWDPDVITDRVVAELWRRSPEQIALIVDEAHLLPCDSPGAKWLSALLQEMPANGHLVVGTRDGVPFGTAKLAAQGGLVELLEADLAFTTEEMADFAALRGVPSRSLRTVGGWPALAELSASTSGARMLDYLWEELLSELPLARRRDLAALSLYAPLDDEIAAALTGHPVDLTMTLAGLPLVSGRPGGERSLHPLWRPVLRSLLHDEEADGSRRRAAAVLGQRGDVEAQVRLLNEAQCWEAIRAVVCEIALRTHPVVAPDVIAEWYRRMPETERARPEGTLMRALVARAHDLECSGELFGVAARRFEQVGNLLGEVAALTHVAHIAWWTHDLSTLDAAIAHVGAYSASHPWLPSIAALGRVLAADASGDADRALEVLGTVDDALVPAVIRLGLDWMWGWEWLLAGRPDRAVHPAASTAASASGTFLAPALNLQLLSQWLGGRIEDALELLPAFAAATVAAGRDLGTVFESSQCALLLAMHGDVEEAKRHLALARTARSGARGAATAEISFVLAAAAVLIAEGDEEGARSLLVAETDYRPLTDDGLTRWHRMFPALSYVLAPNSRPAWHAQHVGPAQAFALELAASLVAVREQGDVNRASRLDLSDAGRVQAQLPVPWVVEIAVAAHAAGFPTAATLLEKVGPAQHACLRALAGSPWSTVARAAKSLLARQPRTPNHRLEIRVLGPLSVLQDGCPVEHPDLRRERVRQLLQYLVMRGPTDRTTVAAELWPDLAPEAAGRNLRVTLSYLLRVLEPDRDEGAAPAYVQTEGGLLGLRLGENLTVDLHQFEVELDAAARAERMGSPSVALEHLARSLPWYRGDCLAGVADFDWADLERDRIRVRYVNAAVRAGDLLLAAGDVETPLRLAMHALRVEPYSEAAYGLLVATRLDRGELDAARSAFRRLLAMLHELNLPVTPRTQMLGRRLESPSGQGFERTRSRSGRANVEPVNV